MYSVFAVCLCLFFSFLFYCFLIFDSYMLCGVGKYFNCWYNYNLNNDASMFVFSLRFQRITKLLFTSILPIIVMLLLRNN